jgi:5-formyltetrahydrofolate cyclo-ligase
VHTKGQLVTIPGQEAAQAHVGARHNVAVMKDALRREVRAERRCRTAEDRDRAAHGLCDVFLASRTLRRARAVALCLPGPGEPGLKYLQAALTARQVRLILPVASSAGGQEWPADSVGQARVVLVPALAVDTLGRRLGRGQDGHDDLLRRVAPGQLVLAAVLDSEVLDAAVEPVPEDEHDARVHGVITPTRVLYLNRP